MYKNYYLIHLTFYFLSNIVNSAYTLDLKLDSLTDKQIIQEVDKIITNKSKDLSNFIKMRHWIENECYKILHSNYKKFCTYFAIKQKTNWTTLKKYHLYQDEITFIFNLLIYHKIRYNKNLNRIMLYHINNQNDKEKLKLLKSLSKINSRWSFLLFIRIKESSLTITRFKEKLLYRYSCINLNDIKLMYNTTSKQQKKYLLIYLFYLHGKIKTLESSRRSLYKTTILLLKKTKLERYTENYYIIWQIAIKYLPKLHLRKHIDKKVAKDRNILSYIIYYGRYELLPKKWIPDFTDITGTKTKITIQRKKVMERNKEKTSPIILGRFIKNKIALKSLLWLWANQEEEGKWIASKHNPFHGNFELPFFEGYEDLWYDIAETSLAIIAFTSSGFTHKSKNIFGSTIKKGIKWIIKNQNKEGLIDIQETPYEFISGKYKEPFSRSKHGSIRAASLYNHNISLYALTELYLLTKDRKLLQPIIKAYKYALSVKYPIVSIPKSLNLDDIGPAVFIIIPLILLNKANILIDNKSIDYIKKYISIMEKENTGQVYAFSPVPRCLGNYDSISALLTIKGLLGMNEEISPSISKSLKFLYNHMPKWNSFYKVPKATPKSTAESFFNDDDIVNEFYWLFGSTAFKFYNNIHFIKWYKKLTKILHYHQRGFGTYFGSFDPEGPWAKVGGRVYMSTMAVLILQSPYLFNYKLFKSK